MERRSRERKPEINEEGPLDQGALTEVVGTDVGDQHIKGRDGMGKGG